MSDADRISEVLLRANRDSRIGDGAFRMLACLLAIAGEDGWVRKMSSQNLGALIGKRERRTRDILGELARAGYVAKKTLGCRLPCAYRVNGLIPRVQQENAASSRQDPADPKYETLSDERAREPTALVLSRRRICVEEKTKSREAEPAGRSAVVAVGETDLVHEILRVDSSLPSVIDALRQARKANGRNFELHKAVLGCFWIQSVVGVGLDGFDFLDRLDAFLDDNILGKAEYLEKLREAMDRLPGHEDPETQRLGELYKILLDQYLAGQASDEN